MRWLRACWLFSVLGLLAACSQPAPLKVGFIGGLSGRFSDLGLSGRNGAMIAVDWRNARGGVAGRQVMMLIRNDEHRAEPARKAFRSLIDEKVLAVVGPMTSAMAVELLPIADETGTLLVGGTIVTNLLTGKSDNLVRVISDTRAYASQTARQLDRIAPSARTAIFYDLANREYAEDWTNNFAEEATRTGKTAVSLHPFDSRQAEAAAAVAAAAMANSPEKSRPDRVVVVCGARDAAIIARIARQRSPGVHLAAAAWAATETLLDEGKDAIEGMVLQQYHNIDDSGETFRNFSAEYLQRFGRPPHYAAVVAFDAMNLLLDALDNHPQAAGLRETILARRQFSGMNGLITLDDNGDAKRPYFSAVVKQNRMVALPADAAP